MTRQLQDVLRRLRRETELGKLRWKKADSRAFRTFVGDSMISLSQDANSGTGGDVGGESGYWVTVYDRSGSVAEEEQITSSDPLDFSLIDDLFKHARRSATNSTAVLDEILRTLDSQAG